MKLISLCIYLFLQREPNVGEKSTTNNRKKKQTKANMSILVR